MKKHKEEKKSWKGTVLIIALFVVLAAAVILFVKPGYLKGALSTTDSDFKQAVEKFNQIDASHNISFSSYEKGITYLRLHPRYPNPFNFDEMEQVASEYSQITGSEAVNLYAKFRKGLIEAEKLHRKAYVSTEGTLEKGYKCKYNQSFFEAYDNVMSFKDAGKEAVSALKSLNESYHSEFVYLNISEEWMKNLSRDFELEAATWEFKKDNVVDVNNKHCINDTSTNQT